MTDRTILANRFLDAAGWGGAEVSILAGDASNRKYFRVKGAIGKPDAVLMDAPQERGEDVRPFIKIATFLMENGLSAPRLYAQDVRNGYLLLEDLGDDLFSDVCTTNTEQEPALYQAATDALMALHNCVPPSLATYGPTLMAGLAADAADWYALGREGRVDAHLKSALGDAMDAALRPHAAQFKVTILRDYHAQNLLWLPDRAGPAKVGLLDFQDAMIGHPTYDLVSLLEDARRDVSAETQAATLAYFISETGSDPAEVRTAYAVMGAQRNLRILMVFARLSLHFGKPDYVDLIPRTWAHLQGNLQHPSLKAVRDAVTKTLPEPTPAHLSELKEKCGTHPTR